MQSTTTLSRYPHPTNCTTMAFAGEATPELTEKELRKLMSKPLIKVRLDKGPKVAATFEPRGD